MVRSHIAVARSMVGADKLKPIEKEPEKEQERLRQQRPRGLDR